MDIHSIAETIGFDISDPKKHKIGLALGGGGIRGYVHLGVLKALEEQGIEVNIIAGTSAGALTGAFIASGMGAKEVHELLKAKNIFEYSKFHWPTDGLFKLDGMKEVLAETIKADQIEALKIPFIATVSNLNKGCVEYMAKGLISEVVLASASIPLIFAPVEMNGDKYVDGGLYDNLPVKPLKQLCEKIIAVSVSPVEETDDLDNLVKVASRTFQLIVNDHDPSLLDQCGILIEPMGIGNYGLLDTDKADELFEIGYKHTQSLDVKKLLDEC
ncbi:patatin-like phospholipase family protein [Reichenbachiella carrageenanivorans]|uniref:Patatin-like phospholipase family protein n=1 Tax=Reichenbachiella carrageenanivorans TaxID=2979869 RepID=A0ABY6D1D3_9BACT|nr:patatin-like phospholipase family protein [Reichenbachiella carrageenanivorans]UXX79410.1 patatin-like phospholipase family protein [Reichenbachiella carrageenanivorans]